MLVIRIWSCLHTCIHANMTIVYQTQTRHSIENQYRCHTKSGIDYQRASAPARITQIPVTIKTLCSLVSTYYNLDCYTMLSVTQRVIHWGSVQYSHSAMKTHRCHEQLIPFSTITCDFTIMFRTFPRAIKHSFSPDLKWLVRP